MAALHAPPRTPSPRLHIHRSQSFSFDSPSSRISCTPIDESPYSKSTSAIHARSLPRYDTLKAAEQGLTMPLPKVMLHTKMSEDSIMSDVSSESSSAASSPTSTASEDEGFGLFHSSSSSSSSSGAPSPSQSPASDRSASPSNTTPTAMQSPLSNMLVPGGLQMYQDADSTATMYDPWLVRVVLDMFDARGFTWMNIAEPIERIWGFRTSSAEVLGILSLNGRVGRTWWD
ncbi:hypothetical protein BS50DRAFT_581694 [Corynespora cassiicola Philippines]|uniref:Uncharacterized protein n=1 Tax=Corynespora cassiicola Philippines TaxID=1448308 RepID=A0A2T2PBA3_CORCC|nr:hypothetical protein BS50DRAFT_581694 [Corynespora cassiicola Philippines]